MDIDDTGIFICTKEVQDAFVVAVPHVFLAVIKQKYQIMTDDLDVFHSQISPHSSK